MIESTFNLLLWSLLWLWIDIWHLFHRMPYCRRHIAYAEIWMIILYRNIHMLRIKKEQLLLFYGLFYWSKCPSRWHHFVIPTHKCERRRHLACSELLAFITKLIVRCYFCIDVDVSVVISQTGVQNRYYCMYVWEVWGYEDVDIAIGEGIRWRKCMLNWHSN